MSGSQSTELVRLGITEDAHAYWDELHEQISSAGPTPCSGAERDRWTGNPAEQRWAAEHCMDCPVMVACLTYAVAAGEKQGVWGGREPAERRRLTLADARPPSAVRMNMHRRH